jgi:hypothetical protein
VSDRLGKIVCVCFLILEVVIIKKGEIVDANVFGVLMMIMMKKSK